RLYRALVICASNGSVSGRSEHRKPRSAPLDSSAGFRRYPTWWREEGGGSPETGSINDLIGPLQHRRPDRQAERFGRFHVNHQFEFRRLLNGKVSWLRTL